MNMEYNKKDCLLCKVVFGLWLSLILKLIQL